MTIVYQHNKKTGLTYAYESKAYWDKEKRQSRSKRTLIGRVDNVTGEIIPTDGRNRKTPSEKRNKKYSEYINRIEKLEKKCLALDALVKTLKKENEKLKTRLNEVK